MGHKQKTCNTLLVHNENPQNNSRHQFEQSQWSQFCFLTLTKAQAYGAITRCYKMLFDTSKFNVGFDSDFF
jgi:hypothetical protein